MEPAIESALGTSTEALTVLRELGRGGMGAVYLAEDHKRGDRCAVKVLHLHLSQDATTVARFRTEARAAAIQHDAIVQSRGIGQLPDGRWYCMMDYVDGFTLTQFCAQRGPLSLALILEIIAPLCEALDQVHAANIIHRDLKPDNVIVVERNGVYAPKLLDFGIAKLMSEPSVTRPGAALGTVAYMAPEQTRGATVDRRCDVYALGVMVYQMITGGAFPYDAVDGALYHEQMTRPPVDPRRRCPTVIEPAVGPILAAIQVDATRRPSTTGTLALMLARKLVGDGTQPDGMTILQARAPRLLVLSNLEETLRAPGVDRQRGTATAPWSYDYGPVLGKGGFGEVLRGTKRGADGFALPVAIKRILPEHAKTPEFVQMFHQEARVAALLSHQNIVKVLDHATDPWGQLVIVMEFIEGVDLDKLRRSGPIPHAVVIFLICEVLEGLGCAHHLRPISGLSSADEIAARGDARGVVHRDMSHDNVMISWHGAVKVMDFGIAKLRARTAAQGSVMLKGKPAYFSPEQANSAVSLDGRSDLFSVGVMLWELLTGRALFQREDLRQTLAAILFDPIDPPSLYNADVPPDLERVTMRLLEKNPSDRFQTADDAIAALGACAATSRTARTRLQQLLAARFPESAARMLRSPAHPATPAGAVGAAPDDPSGPIATLPARWEAASANTTHGQAAGQTVAATATVRTRRTPTIAVLAATVALGTAATVLVVSRLSSDGSNVEPQPSAAPAAPKVYLAADGAVAGIRPSTPDRTAPAPQDAPASIALSPTAAPSATMSVFTEPSGAMVRIEDATTLVAAGPSPITIHVPHGAHVQIRADLGGFEPLIRTVAVGEQGQQTITLTLTRMRSLVPRPSKPAQQPVAPSANTPAAKPQRAPAKPKDDAADEIMK